MLVQLYTACCECLKEIGMLSPVSCILGHGMKAHIFFQFNHKFFTMRYFQWRNKIGIAEVIFSSDLK